MVPPGPYPWSIVFMGSIAPPPSHNGGWHGQWPLSSPVMGSPTAPCYGLPTTVCYISLHHLLGSRSQMREWKPKDSGCCSSGVVAWWELEGATNYPLAGCMWPLGHQLDSPVLDAKMGFCNRFFCALRRSCQLCQILHWFGSVPK